MHLDVLDLQTFYYRSNLGRVAGRAIRERVRALWPDVGGECLVGFGFAVPLLRPFLGEAERVTALMPAGQGVMSWPPGRDNHSVLAGDWRWPVAAGGADRLVLMHGLETSERPGALLDECARVLEANGRAIFVVPNRVGLWARRDRTPFGAGRPYSLSQLEGQLRTHGFTPERRRAALFSPPSGQRFWLKTAAMWERAGQRVSTHFAGGVLVVEATKALDVRGTPAESRERRPLRVLEGAPQPAPAPS